MKTLTTKEIKVQYPNPSRSSDAEAGQFNPAKYCVGGAIGLAHDMRAYQHLAWRVGYPTADLLGQWLSALKPGDEGSIWDLAEAITRENDRGEF